MALQPSSASRRRLRRRILRLLDRVAPAAAWGLVIGAAVTFLGVLTGIIATGEFRLGTLLISADLAVSGYGQLRDEQRDGEV